MSIPDFQNRMALEKIEEYLQDGIDSGPSIEVTKEFWQRLHDELEQRTGNITSASDIIPSG